MTFVVDECCDDDLTEWLRAGGHDVVSIRETAPGSKDQVVLKLSVDQQRILLTEDKDFGELVIRLGLDAFCIFLFRLRESDAWSKINRLNDVLQLDPSRFIHHLVVIESDKTRFRSLPSKP